MTLAQISHDYDLLREKLHRLRTARIIETAEAVKFQLDKQIEEADAALNCLVAQLGNNDINNGNNTVGFRVVCAAQYSLIARTGARDCVGRARESPVPLRRSTRADPKSASKARCFSRLVLS